MINFLKNVHYFNPIYKKEYLKMKLLTLTATLLLSLASFNAMAVGAIAVDDEAGSTDTGYGIVTGMSSEAEAKAGALKECKSAGNNCKVAVWFTTCGAYANSKEYSGIGYGNTKAIAEAKALEACGGNCKIQVSDCE
jgi:hypothetical protein